MQLPPLHAPRTLRGRLTLWNVLILGVVLVLFTLVVYSILAHSLSVEVERSLDERADQINTAFQQQASYLSRFRQHQSVNIPPPNPSTFASSDSFVQIVSLDGQVLGTSDSLGNANLPLDAVTFQSGQPHYQTVQLGHGSVEVYSRPLVINEQVIGVVQVGRPLGPIQHALGQLRLFAGLGLVAALILSGLVVSAVSGKALRPLERLIRTAESIGSSRDLSRRVTPPSSDDEVGRLTLTFNQMLSRLEASDRQLRESLETQRRFTADASHELRTPLTSIRGNSGMLMQVPDMTAEDRAEAVEEIHREAERMSRLVGDLLTLARADAGLALKREPVEMASLVQSVASQARMLASGQRIVVEAPDSVMLMGSPDALRQLVLILLDNAIKYTSSGGLIKLRLSLYNQVVVLTVADTGVGISPEHLPHVFERFYRVDPARTAGGTGLGLSIAQWIAQQHGGYIEAESISGRGSAFTVHLPMDSSSTEREFASTDVQQTQPTDVDGQTELSPS